MKHIAITTAFVMVTSYAYADQSIYIDQVSGDNLNLTISQSNGDGNEVGNPTSVNPYFSISGNSQTLDFYQFGAGNTITGSITGTSLGFDIDQVGDNNAFDILVSNADNADFVLDFIGSTNTIDLDAGQNNSAEYADVDITTIGSTNTFDIDIEADGATQSLTLTGSNNTYTLNQSGYGTSLDGHTSTVTSTGSFNTVSITQDGTLNANTVGVNLNGDNQTVTITQSD